MTTYAHLAPEDLRPILDQIDQARAVYEQTRDPVLIDRIAHSQVRLYLSLRSLLLL